MACSPSQGSDGPRPGIRLAVIGDSDSHAYHDSVTFPLGGRARGGARRAQTFQWTEVLQRLRGATLDQGVWGARGVGPRVARVAAWFGVSLRSPRKQDFAYNVAYSGHRCADLLHPRGQVGQVEQLLRSDPQGWSQGVVVIRIGINDLGTRDQLRRVAAGEIEASGSSAVGDCLREITQSVDRLQARLPTLRIVLVGIDDNAGWPPLHGEFQSAAAMLHLRAYHDAFDNGLRAIAADRKGVAFLNERWLFQRYWGGRTADGVPDYRAVSIAGLTVTPTQGDALEHMTLADGHAGTVANTLWAKALVDVLTDSLALEVPRISTAEIEAFLQSL